MKRLFIVAAVCVAFCLTSFAQGSDDAPATKEDVQRYLEVAHSHEMITKVMDAMAAPMHQMVHQQYLRDKDRLPSDFEDRMNKVMDSMFHDMPWDDMIQSMVPVYQKHFTKRNIDDLIAFYSSPTGQKLLQEMPAITAESMQVALPLIQNYVKKVQERVEQETAELKKSSPHKQAEIPSSLRN